MPKGRDLWGWPPVVILLGVVSVLLGLSAFRISLRYQEVRKERQVLQEKVNELKAEIARTEETIRASGSSEVIEKLAKDRLNLKRPEEEVVVVLPKRDNLAASAPDMQNGDFIAVADWFRSLASFFRR